jgi:hypothetical protein
MAGETEVLGENLPRRHFVHHKSHLTRPGIGHGTGLFRENVYLYDVQVSTCLVEAYEDYNCFEVSFFCRVERFKMEQRAAIECCVKLKTTATEMLEILKSAYAEELIKNKCV